MNRSTPNGTESMAGDTQEGPPVGPRSPAPAARGTGQAVDADRQVLAKMAALRRILGHSVLTLDDASDR